ncbi:LamB/YcsF family protein [Catenulispora yoronensis]|uniref:LamB/YcsF family protein n=1 Tax=Catenulispora yoronensis TaxID=450799 RepID=UPI0031DE2509
MLFQIGAPDAFARAAGDRMRYVKPHGVLSDRGVPGPSGGDVGAAAPDAAAHRIPAEAGPARRGFPAADHHHGTPDPRRSLRAPSVHAPGDTGPAIDTRSAAVNPGGAHRPGSPPRRPPTESDT